MAIYNINDVEIFSIYDIDCHIADTAYDINGQSIAQTYPEDSNTIFAKNVSLSALNSNDVIGKNLDPPEFIALRIRQTKIDGTKQYPFVRYKRGKALELLSSEGWNLIINAGLGVSDEQPVDGVLIENRNVICNEIGSYHYGIEPMTIDANGQLGYALSSATGAELSATYPNVCNGFCPIVVDGNKYSYNNVSVNGGGNHFNALNPRQIFGQFENGDYCVVTQQGRQLPTAEEIQLSVQQGLPVNLDRKGWKLSDAADICIALGMKFAYCLDGGQSVATIMNQNLLTPNTPIFFIKSDGTIPANRINGRTIPSFIVFNGTTQFNIPTAP